MEFIVGTSRYYSIVDYFWYEESIPGEAYGGGKIPLLIQKGLDMLRITGFNRRNDNILYVGGGMPDITVKCKNGRYEEVIHQGEPETLVDTVVTQIREGAERILATGTTPVFTTVCPMDISIWNHHRLQCYKTSHLEYQHDYQDMQALHQQTVELLNHEINAINDSNGMRTPTVSKNVFQKKGAGLPYRLRTPRLQSDGCHLTPESTGEWIQVLRDCMGVNRVQLYNKNSYGEAYPENFGVKPYIPSISYEENFNESFELQEMIDCDRDLACVQDGLHRTAVEAADFYRRNPHLFINY